MEIGCSVPSERLSSSLFKPLETLRKRDKLKILLKTDSGEQGPSWADQPIQSAFGVGRTTIWRVRERFLRTGLSAALARRGQPDRPAKRKLDGEKEAHLIALICAGPPETQERWSLRLLAEKLVQLGETETISHETVRQTLKKTS